MVKSKWILLKRVPGMTNERAGLLCAGSNPDVCLIRNLNRSTNFISELIVLRLTCGSLTLSKVTMIIVSPVRPQSKGISHIVYHIRQIDVNTTSWSPGPQDHIPTKSFSLTMPQAFSDSPPRPEFIPFTIPYICKSAPYDGKDFWTYPERRGW